MATTGRSDVVPLLAEVFRAYGFEGASLARITEGTGLGKGSLYNFFPGGKDEMAQAVLSHIDQWFRTHVFTPLEDESAPADGIIHMFDECNRYFLAGRKVCLVGAFALSNTRDQFALAVRDYFVAWGISLHRALQRLGHPAQPAAELTEEILGAIQGALVLARAIDTPDVFTRTLQRLQSRALEVSASGWQQK